MVHTIFVLRTGTVEVGTRTSELVSCCPERGCLDKLMLDLGLVAGRQMMVSGCRRTQNQLKISNR